MDVLSHVNFRILNISYSQSPPSENLKDFVLTTPRGFHAFFTSRSLISGIRGGLTIPTREFLSCFDPLLPIQHGLHLQALNNLDNWFSDVPSLHLIGEKATDKLPQNVLHYCQKLRDILAADHNIYTIKAGYSLNQAIIFTLSSDRYEQSPLHPGNTGYEEYLLWNDGGLWGEAAWRARLVELESDNLVAYPINSTDPAVLRLVWLGAGWLCSRLVEAIVGQPEPWFYEPDIGHWAKLALDSLAHFDDTLISYYQKEYQQQPPGRKSWNNYVRVLCDFLPFHYSGRNGDGELLPSNSLGNKGGPRPWPGLLHGSVNMHIRHLLFDGWLSLWPMDGQDDGKLYLQPSSIALLYWAARYADMPHTGSPKDFLQGYDWSDPLWFGGMWHKLTASGS